MNDSTRILVLLGMLTHAAFFATIVPTIRKAYRNSCHTKSASSTASTEGLFISMNIAGTLCAIIGFCLMLVQSDVRPLTRYQQKILVLVESAFVLSPYLLIAATWLWFAYRKPQLMDEKQGIDINRAGITTWLVSLPLLFGLFLAQYRVEGLIVPTIWFPAYVFITLFVFSACSLWYYNRT
jgi:hypothetical protein